MNSPTYLIPVKHTNVKRANALLQRDPEMGTNVYAVLGSRGSTAGQKEKESVADPGSPNRDQHLRNAGRKNIGITILSQMVAGLWSPTRCQTVLEQIDAEQQKLEPVQWDLFVGMGGNTKKMLKLSVAVAEKAEKV